MDSYPPRAPAWPWSTGISHRQFLILWIGAVALLEAVGILLARVSVGFDWVMSLALATFPGPVLLFVLGAVGWAYRPTKRGGSA